MAKSSGGDLITHCNSARTRVVGDGELKGLLEDSVGNAVYMVEGTMSETTGKSITHLQNFRAERICYEIWVDGIDQWFIVSNMFAYVKPTATSYPQP